MAVNVVVILGTDDSRMSATKKQLPTEEEINDWTQRSSRRKSQRKEKVDRDLGTIDSAAGLYEVLKASKFVSDHIVYRLLTPVYTGAFVLLLVLYYSIEHVGALTTLLDTSIMVSLVVAYSSILRFSAIRWYDYQYYLAKGYLTLSESQTHNVIRLRFFIDGTEAYNLFLQRNLKIKIKELQVFYSRLSSDSFDVSLKTMKNIYHTFQDAWNPDKLEPFRQIRTIIESLYQKSLLIGASKRRDLQDWLPLIGLITTSIIAIIQLLINT